MKVSEAFKLLTEEEAAKLINEEELKVQALRNAEQNGIVFLDEIDKIARRQDVQGADVSREGVQRDLLPLVEGSTVNTKYGMVKTDHILFIASGAFHMSKPSDLIPELQGRLPIRVELEALKVEDFVRILTEPDASLCTQYAALVATEGVQLSFQASGVRRIAEVAFDVNQRTENIGARRLHTVMERLLETISFEASDRSGTSTDDRPGLRRRESRRAGAGRGPREVHPVMPGTRDSAARTPTEIKLRKQSRLLEVTFDDGSASNCRSNTCASIHRRPKCAVTAPGQETLQLGKHAVGIRSVDPVGNYAVRAGVRRRPRFRASTPGPTCTNSAPRRPKSGSIISTASPNSASPTPPPSRHKKA